jgi:hypothetical protein
MNCAEILKNALTHTTLENLFKEFLNTVYLYSSFDCISKEQFHEVAEVLNEEESGFYSVEENDKTTTILTKFNKYLYSNEKMRRIQNYTYEIENCNDEDSQILIISEDNIFKAWFLPIFFKEFYVFCEGINNTIKKENKNKENINNKITEIKEETFSLENIYNIAEHSDKIIHICDELKDIGFNNEEIFEIITNIIKKIG